MKSLLQKHAFLLAFGWTALIFLLCCTPGRYVPTAHWLDLLSFDKFVHASIFFVLTILWLNYAMSQQRKVPGPAILIIVGCVAYGGILEVLQATVFSQRSGDWFDFIANTFGCLMAWWLFSRRQARTDAR